MSGIPCYCPDRGTYLPVLLVAGCPAPVRWLPQAASMAEYQAPHCLMPRCQVPRPTRA
jgi:hypothetical protein